MTLQDWGALGEVIGAIAVLCSLVYLALQIRQNTRSVTASTIQNLSESYREIFTTIAIDPVITPILLKDVGGLELTDEEEFRISAFQAVSWRAMENIYIQSQRGTVDTSYLEIRARGAAAMFTERAFRRWSDRKDSFPADFVEYVERKFQEYGVRTDADA